MTDFPIWKLPEYYFKTLIGPLLLNNFSHTHLPPPCSQKCAKKYYSVNSDSSRLVKCCELGAADKWMMVTIIG